MDNFSLVKLKRFSSICEAELAKSLLESFGIKSIIKNSGIQFSGDLGDGYGADLFILQKDFDRANEILEEKEN